MSSELYLDYKAGTATRQITRHGEDYGEQPGNEASPTSWGDTSLISGFVSTLNDCPEAEVRQLLAARIIQTGDNVGKSIDRITDAEDAGRRAVSSVPEAS